MPFKSKAQQRKFFAMAHRGRMPLKTAKEFAAHTDFAHLPNRLHRKPKRLAYGGTCMSCGGMIGENGKCAKGCKVDPGFIEHMSRLVRRQRGR